MNQNKIEANKEQRPTDVASGAVLGGWREISTAPTDGTHILAASKYGGNFGPMGYFCIVVKWWPDAFGDACGGWIGNDSDLLEDASLYCGITHWMPLPQPPLHITESA